MARNSSRPRSVSIVACSRSSQHPGDEAAIGSGVDPGRPRASRAAASPARRPPANRHALDPAPGDRERQHIAADAGRGRHLDEGERRTLFADGQRRMASRRICGSAAPFSANQRREARKCGSTSRSSSRRERPSVSARQPLENTSVTHSCGEDRLGRGAVLVDELEPEEAVGRQRDDERRVADALEARLAEHLERHAAAPGGEVELGRLRRARQVGDAQDDLVAELAQIDQHGAVGRADEGERAAAEHLRGLAHGDQPLHPASAATTGCATAPRH